MSTLCMCKYVISHQVLTVVEQYGLHGDLIYVALDGNSLMYDANYDVAALMFNSVNINLESS